MNINEAAPGRPPASTPHMKGETMNLIAMALGNGTHTIYEEEGKDEHNVCLL